MTEMPHKTMTYLRMYSSSFPIVPNDIGIIVALIWDNSSPRFSMTYLRMYSSSFPIVPYIGIIVALIWDNSNY
jgi:hypothetical protein